LKAGSAQASTPTASASCLKTEDERLFLLILKAFSIASFGWVGLLYRTGANPSWTSHSDKLGCLPFQPNANST